MVFNDFIKDDFIPEGDGQVASGSAALPDPVVLETKEQMLEREQNERDVLDALGEYEYDSGMSVQDVKVKRGIWGNLHRHFPNMPLHIFPI